MKSGSIWAGVVSLVLIMSSCSKYTTPVTTPVPATPSGTVTNGNMEEGILANINAYRRSKGLAELQMTGSANQQAAEHSRNMAIGATSFGHDGFQQRVSNIVDVIGRVSASAENVAFGHLSAKQVVDGWLRSSGHKRNIEGNYNLTGVGVYSAPNGDLYFTQIFLKK
jgi:uncharacterized protein YkwD